ncbi:MAG TPA: hypothetical protein VNH15_04570 [Elusimicrobiota bacterium]|nr:hypothetical protein [Elusimicrobiota bacterium]
MQIIFAYLLLPLVLSWLVVKFLKTYSRNEVPPDIQGLYLRTPLARGQFRLVEREGGRMEILEDCPSHEEAVEKAYRAMRRAKEAGKKASFLVLNHEGAAFDQIES